MHAWIHPSMQDDGPLRGNSLTALEACFAADAALLRSTGAHACLC